MITLMVRNRIPGPASLLSILILLLSTPAGRAQIQLGNHAQNVPNRDLGEDPGSAGSTSSILLNAFYTGDIITNGMGGVRQGTDYLHVINLMCTMNLDQLINWNNATFCIDLLGINGGNPSHNTGDFQGVSNIAAVSSWRPYELWLQQNFLSDRLSTLIGVYDVNSEFDVIETAGLFINSSFSMGPEFSKSGKNGAPTFPYPGLAMRVKARLSDNLLFQTAIMDGLPGDPDNPGSTQYRINKEEGALLSTELIFMTGKDDVSLLLPVSRCLQHRRRRIGFHELRGITRGRGTGRERGRGLKTDIAPQSYSKVAFGSWYYTSEFDDIRDYDAEGNPVVHKGNWGIYGLGEKIFFTNGGNTSEYVSVFLRAGISDKQINSIDGYLGCGIVLSESFSRSFQDPIGFAVAAAHISNKYSEITQPGNSTADNWEVSLELSYRAQVSSIFALQPDIQYVINPGIDPSIENVLIMGMRLELAFQ